MAVATAAAAVGAEATVWCGLCRASVHVRGSPSAATFRLRPPAETSQSRSPAAATLQSRQPPAETFRARSSSAAAFQSRSLCARVHVRAVVRAACVGRRAVAVTVRRVGPIRLGAPRVAPCTGCCALRRGRAAGGAAGPLSVPRPRAALRPAVRRPRPRQPRLQTSLRRPASRSCRWRRCRRAGGASRAAPPRAPATLASGSRRSHPP
jgi:hypothetical protein